MAYDRTAELAGEYLKKGSEAYFDGRLKRRKYTDKEGIDRYSTDIVIDEMQFIGGRSKSDGESKGSGGGGSKSGAASGSGQRGGQAKTAAGSNDFDDDSIRSNYGKERACP